MTAESELLAAVREIIRNVILTMGALRDPDARYLGWSKMPMHVVHDIREAYGYSSASARLFEPTPRHISQMEQLAPWLAWLRREHGDIELRRLMAWALGAPLWRLGERERCSDDTIRRRIDRSIARMIEEFVGASLPIEYLEEPYEETPHAIIFSPPNATSDGEVRPTKIYIGGKGMYKTKGDGKPGRFLDNRHRRWKDTA